MVTGDYNTTPDLTATTDHKPDTVEFFITDLDIDAATIKVDIYGLSSNRQRYNPIIEAAHRVDIPITNIIGDRAQLPGVYCLIMDNDSYKFHDNWMRGKPVEPIIFKATKQRRIRSM